MLEDDLIDKLIEARKPVQKFSGFDWTQTDKLKPTGAAERHRILAETLQPENDDENP